MYFPQETQAEEQTHVNVNKVFNEPNLSSPLAMSAARTQNHEGGKKKKAKAAKTSSGSTYVRTKQHITVRVGGREVQRTVFKKDGKVYYRRKTTSGTYAYTLAK